jgi:type II secretory ATPase GspE/PulE/Tfp pilus assembly ATPase PilB-like protein
MMSFGSSKNAPQVPRLAPANGAQVKAPAPAPAAKPNARDGTFPVTAVGTGDVPIQHEERDLFCLMSDGTLLICSGESNHTLVQSFIKRCRMIAPKVAHATIRRHQEVSPEHLQELYKAGNRGKAVARTRVEVIGDEDASQRQTEFLQIVRQAVSMSASDIHMLVNENSTQIKMRVDGLVTSEPVKQGSAAWGNSLAQSIFHSMTDVSGTNYTPASAQDAMVRTKVPLPEEISSIRIGTLPRVGTTNALFFRLFYRGHSGVFDLDELGYEPSQREAFHRIASNPYGILIITGPTGSGKTTTLHVALRQFILRTNRSRNVIMIEDPTEIEVSDVIQTAVTRVGDEDRASAYRGVIRAAMRSDPDVMMISEMRDVATAEAALNAAMTGHFVFTTLHANNAFNALPRLERMGIPPYLLYDHNIVAGIVAQRLVRKVCPNCSIQLSSQDAVNKFGSAQISRLFKVPGLAQHSDSVRLRGDGCKECGGRGSKGRLCVAEVVEMDATIAHPFKNGNPDLANVIWRDVRKNLSMKDVALLHVQRGRTCPLDAEEVVGKFNDPVSTVNFTEIDQASRLFSQQSDSSDVSSWSQQ